jgi:hypothetical protein
MNTKQYLLATLFIASGLFVNGQTPTWSNKIASIFYNNCSSCHREGGIGLFPLMSYSDATSHSLIIKSQVESKMMPPWKADPNYKHFKDERFLTNSQIADIADWVDNGTPAGDLSTAPSPPVFPIGSQMTSIDQTLTLPKYRINTSADEYRSFVIHSGISTDKFLNEIEYLPGNGAIVHHVVLYKDPSNYSDSLDNLDTIAGFSSYGSVAVSPNATFLGAWAPGSGIFKIPTNFGIRVDANSDYVVELHYAPGSAGQTDSTVLHLKYTTYSPIREVYIDPILNHFLSMTNGPINIAPNTIVTYYERELIPFGSDFSILAVFPHMHKVGASFKIWNYVPATHDSVPIIEIPKWDFHWQGFYTNQRIMKIPGNSKLEAKAQYDNTSANHDNPYSPPQRILSGEHTTQEMMIAFFAYTEYQLGDENVILDSTILNTDIEEMKDPDASISIYPNPTTDQLNVRIKAIHDGYYYFDFINQQGQSVKTFDTFVHEGDAISIPIELSTFAQGIYAISITNKDGLPKILRFVKM